MEEAMENCNDERNLEDVISLISLAKLEERDLKPLSQSLFFADDSDNSNLKLIELDNVLLRNVQEGFPLIIRGNEDDEAVLCTDDATYEVRGAETSNSLLLLPGLILPDRIPDTNEENRVLEKKQVLPVIHNYYELRKCKPKTNRIINLLEKSIYRGKEYENDLTSKLYTLEDLLDVVQCSKKELLDALLEMEAYHINGFWRFLEFDYNFRVLTYLLNLIEENSWPLDQVPLKEAVESLSDLVPLEILHQCIQYYCEPTEVSCSKGKELYRLKEDKVCRFLAKVLLKPTGKFNLEEFLEAWQQSVPEGMKTSVKQLEGLALVDTSESPPVARYFPESELHEDPGKRFEVLFHVKPKWTLEEITPYIERLAPSKANVSTLLMRYARAYQDPNGKGRLYTSRH